MDKFKLIFNFLKGKVIGKNTITFIVAIFAIFMYKILGFLGLLFGLFVMIGIDVCDTTTIKKIITFYKDYNYY